MMDFADDINMALLLTRELDESLQVAMIGSVELLDDLGNRIGCIRRAPEGSSSHGAWAFVREEVQA